MKTLIYKILFFCLIITNISFSANELWRSRISGNWNTPATWEFSINGGGTWIIATSTFPDVTSSTTTIRSPNTVTIPASTPLTNNILVIDGGGILTLNSASSLTISGSLTLFGTISGSGAITTSGSPQFNIRNGSVFSAPLTLNTGDLNIYNTDGGATAELRGAITISPNRTLNVNGGGYGLRAFNNVTNNGLISGSGSSFIMRGSSLINTGTINSTNFNFDSTTLLDGNGIWNSSNININPTGIVTLNDTVVFGNTNVVNVNVNGGGVINGAAQYLLLNGTANQVNLTVNANGKVGNANTTNVHTRGTVVMNIRNSALFNAALNIKNGTTTVYNDNSGNTAEFNGTILIDASTTFNVSGGGYTALAKSNVTNNGTITGGGSAFITRGPNFTNNSTINVTTFNFEATTALFGAGVWASSNININSPGNVSISSNNIAFGAASVVNFNINAGGTLNPNTRTVTMKGTSNNVNFTLNGDGSTFNSGIFQNQGTVVMNIRNNSNFSSPLKVNTGQTFGYNDNAGNTGILYNTLTVDLNAGFTVQGGGYTIQANNDVINNGTIIGSGSSFTMTGNNFANSGSIAPTNFNFNDTTSISGNGLWNPANLNINGNALVSLSNSLTFGGPNPTNFNVSGSLNPNTFTATLNGSLNTFNFYLNNLGTLLNSGVLQSQGNVSLVIRNGSQFNVPFKANTGTASFLNDNAGNEAVLNNTVLVDAGAVLNVQGGGYFVRANDTVTNNGTITGSGSTFRFFGPVFTNNGIVNPTTFLFESIIFSPTSFHTLQGTGSFTTSNCQIREGAYVVLGTNHQFLYLTVNTGSTFDITSRTLRLNGAGIPIAANGSIVTSGSTIEYNGTAVQNFPQPNINYINVRINDTAGVTLVENISIPGLITIANGDLNLNGRVITLLATGSFSETPGNTLTGNSGFIVTIRNLNAPSNLNVAGLGASITTGTNLGLTEIKRGPVTQTLFSGKQTIRRYYTIKPVNNSNLNATLVFRYDESELNGNSETLLRLYESTNAGATYEYEGGTLNTTLNQITLNNISSFARYTAASAFGFANITCLIEAYYDLNTLKLNMKDTITVQLRKKIAPFNLIDSAKSTLDSVTFKSSLRFYNAPTDTYYVVVNQRNSLQTWSRQGGEPYVVSDTLNYNFSDFQSKAFGNNTVQVGTKWTNYSGDVNQNGFIDLADVVLTNNGASAFSTGYVTTDVNGNRIVDLEDVLITYGNSNKFVSVKKP
ncbi:MAG: hypothetical protein IPL53_03730 [Ignavibacteria bacterium]|nr:hypothetical protein [Ignavibacteria bacterium]